MMQAMVLSIIGKDKQGLVDELAKVVQSVNGNWLKSSFCHLSGHFAGFVEIMLPKEHQTTLVDKCSALSDLSITLAPAHEADHRKQRSITVKVTGNDRRGIVSDVTGVLRSFDVNISELKTSCESAPNWGSLLFTAIIEVDLLNDIDTAEIKTSVENIADDLMVDLIE